MEELSSVRSACDQFSLMIIFLLTYENRQIVGWYHSSVAWVTILTLSVSASSSPLILSLRGWEEICACSPLLHLNVHSQQVCSARPTANNGSRHLAMGTSEREKKSFHTLIDRVEITTRKKYHFHPHCQSDLSFCMYRKHERKLRFWKTRFLFHYRHCLHLRYLWIRVSFPNSLICCLRFKFSLLSFKELSWRIGAFCSKFEGSDNRQYSFCSNPADFCLVLWWL